MYCQSFFRENWGISSIKICGSWQFVVLVFPRKDRWDDSAVFLHAQKSSQSDGRKARRWSVGSYETFCSVPAQMERLVWSRNICDRKKEKQTCYFKNLGMHKIYIHNWRNGGVVFFKKKVKLHINTLWWSISQIPFYYDYSINKKRPAEMLAKEGKQDIWDTVLSFGLRRRWM